MPAGGDAEDAPLVFRVWEPDTTLFEAGFGTLAPGAGAPAAVPDILVLPLVGFDAIGTRLGYGRGYYDRTIAALREKAAARRLCLRRPSNCRSFRARTTTCHST